jgi:hypothetical protein
VTSVDNKYVQIFGYTYSTEGRFVSLNFCHFDSVVPINLYYLTLALTLKYSNIQEYMRALLHFTPDPFLFFILTSLLLIVGAEGYCGTWNTQWHTHTHKQASSGLLHDNTQHSHQCRRLGAGFEPASQEARGGRSTTPTARPATSSRLYLRSVCLHELWSPFHTIK